MADSLDVQAVPDMAAPTIRVAGEIDASNVHQLSSFLDGAVGNSDMGLVVDLTPATYIDSAGIRAIFVLARQLKLHQQRLRLVVPADASIRRSLTYSGLLDAVHVVETLEEGTDLETHR
jgi:anti-anti-sigma factor